MTQIAIVIYPGSTALDFIDRYEVLRWLPDTGSARVARTVPDHRRLRLLIIGETHWSPKPQRRTSFCVPGGCATIEHAATRCCWTGCVLRTRPQPGRRRCARARSSSPPPALLDGKRATSHWAALTMLKALGAKPVSDERVVHEGQIVTSARYRRHRLGALAGRPDRRRGAREGHSAVHGVRPAAAVRQRPHVQSIGEDQGGRHRADGPRYRQTGSAQGGDATAVEQRAGCRRGKAARR